MPLRFLLSTSLLVTALILLLLGVGEGQDPTVEAAYQPSPLDWSDESSESREGMDRQAYVRALHAMPAGVRWFLQERLNTEARWRVRQDPAAGSTLPGASNRWVEVGPNNQAGKTSSVAMSPDGTLYLGSAAGGVWKGTLAGDSWEPISDDVGGGVDEILCLPGRVPGEPDALLVRRGARVVWSPDEGQTWSTPTGLEDAARGLRLLRLSNGEVLFLCGAHRSRDQKTTLFVSQDRGASFSIRYQTNSHWRGDMLARPDGPDGPDLLWINRRRLLQSTDQGRTWVSRGSLPVGGSTALLSRGGGVHPTVYLALHCGEMSGQSGWRLFAFDDHDLRMEERTELPECWRSFAALPYTAGGLWTGGLEAHGSFDGGRSFRKANSWQDYYDDPQSALHADIRGLQAMPNPANPSEELLFAHTDGGTYLSRDGGVSFDNLCTQGLRVGQVYDTYTQSGPAPTLWIGTQDQGLQAGTYDPFVDRGKLPEMRQHVSGDYGYLIPIAAQGALAPGLLASYPGFVLWFDADLKVGRRLAWPEGAQTQWMPPLHRDPLSTQAAWLLAERLYRFQRDDAGLWSVQAASNLDLMNTQAEHLVAMGSARGGRTLYIADNSGTLWRSTDGGEHFEPRGSTIDRDRGHHLLARSIWVDGAQSKHLWVAGTGYVGPAVLRSQDGGLSFEAIGEGLPKTLVHDLERGVDGLMYAASDAGPLVFDEAQQRWLWIEGDRAPNTVYSSVEALDVERIMRFGTFGRGVWDYHLPVPAPIRRPR